MIKKLFSFIKSSPTAFHAVDTIKNRLDGEGFIQLNEGEKWDIVTGTGYYVIRNGSSIIAFKAGENTNRYSFSITASHSDSPTFKLKENAVLNTGDRYARLNTEGYGGMICASWLDRPLSIAGRAVIKDGNEYITKLVDIDRDLVLIPNLSIHMNRKINEGYAYNKQTDMIPLLGGKACEADELKALIADDIGVTVDSLYGMDLFLYNRMEPSVWGMNNEFISSGRLDDLECAFTSLEGFISGHNDKSIQVYCCFDNEEVGSGTKQGAASTFISEVLGRISAALGKSQEEHIAALSDSFMISCDNAHAVHPNNPSLTDDTNCAYMNGGIVIKSNASQKYTSDAVSIAIFKGICEDAGVPVQYFANRSDMAGGSTLGNIAMSQASMNCIDIGLAQLAMHSVYETAGARDVEYMVQAMTAFYNSHICSTDSGHIVVSE